MSAAVAVPADAITKDTSAADFLTLAGLSKFTGLFVDEGFDDVESLAAIEKLEPGYWEELAKRGFKLGHKLKLLNKLQELGLS